MAKKYYSVKNGVKPGIYETWAECQLQTSGFPGAEYKSFTKYEEAVKYLEGQNDKQLPYENEVDTEAIAYVAGDYDLTKKLFSFGLVIECRRNKELYSEAFNDDRFAGLNKIAGEIKASEKAMRYCIDNKIKSLTIYHDYEGISKWCTGEWQAKKDSTKAYKRFFEEAAKQLDIYFVNIKGYTNDRYYRLANQLAVKALK